MIGVTSLVGFGEAGQAFAQPGVAAFDIATENGETRPQKIAEFESAEIRWSATPAGALAHAELVLSLVTADQAHLTWTRGQPMLFRSSAKVKRGFCAKCGTPLTYDYFDSKHINLTTGSFDEPAKFAPRMQFGVEGQLALFADLPISAEGTTEETMSSVADAIKASNHQHPDHDTPHWPA